MEPNELDDFTRQELEESGKSLTDLETEDSYMSICASARKCDGGSIIW